MSTNSEQTQLDLKYAFSHFHCCDVQEILSFHMSGVVYHFLSIIHGTKYVGVLLNRVKDPLHWPVCQESDILSVPALYLYDLVVSRQVEGCLTTV